MKLKYIIYLSIIFYFLIPNDVNSQVFKVELNKVSKNKNVTKKILKIFPLSSITKINVSYENKKFKTFYYGSKIGSSESVLSEILIKTGEVKTTNLNLKISIIDVNKNQKFNNVDKDLLILSRINEDSILTHETKISNTYIKKLPFNFKVDNKIFKIENIDSRGGSITLSEITSEIYSAVLTTKIENRSFKTINNTKVNLNDFLNLERKVYLNFISTKCEPYIKKIPKLIQFINNHNKEITVINFFSDKDTTDDIKQLVDKYDLKSISLITTTKFNKEMDVIQFPFGVLLDSKGSILHDLISFEDIVF